MTSSATRGQEPEWLPGANIITRFAPSPTGALHLGHAYSAIRAHDLARRHAGIGGGQGGAGFLLRIEDIDGARSRADHIAGIIDDLTWLGLRWDGPVTYQSARLPLYADALDHLQAMDLLYPCFCTRADIAASLGAPQAGDAVAVYPGTCRSLPSPVRAEKRALAPHAWRIDMARAVGIAGPLHWHDALAGHVVANPLAQGDVVLARKDAPASYHLAVTVDDAAQCVSDVMRGADLFIATHIHRLLQALLGLPTPRYHHHPLLADENGRRLAKRDGAPTLAQLRALGQDGAELAQMLRTGALPIGIAAIPH